MIIADSSKAIEGRLKQAVARLMTVRVDGERARLTVPVLYPSGSGCAVEIMTSGDKCFVSDLGFGHMEAEMQGADAYYGVCAKSASERFGVGFDGLSVFTTWASFDKIEGAIAGVANASVQAAATAIFRAVEEKDKQKNTELFERVKEIFGAPSVARSADLKGRDAVWQAHNIVLLSDHRRAVFEFVSENTNSISSKFLMFSDLSKRKDEFSLNSVVRSVEKLGRKGAMLADVSNILSVSDPAAEFIRYAKAG
jgi:hypothetical protein